MRARRGSRRAHAADEKDRRTDALRSFLCVHFSVPKPSSPQVLVRGSSSPCGRIFASRR